MDKSEVLVHISAPSGVVDDARYRAQVEAILNFQCYSRETIPLSTAPHAEAAGTDPEVVEPGDSTSHNLSPPVPEPLHRVGPRDGPLNDKNSLETPVSVIPDSQPDLEQLGLSAESPSSSLLPLQVPESPYVPAYIPAKRRRLDSPPPVTYPEQEDGQVQCARTPIAESRKTISTHVSPTKIVDPPAISNKEKETRGQLAPTEALLGHSRHDHNGLAQCEITAIPTTSGHETGSVQASPTTIVDTPVVPKRQREKESNERQRPESEPVAKPAPGTEPEAQPKDSESSTALTPPLEIKPPPPPIAQSPFTTHITPTLEMLTKRLNPLRTYNPTTQTRDLDTLERGYWYFHINLVPETEATAPGSLPNPTYWDKPLFTRFWTFLTELIAKEGRAGWGVWCILEERDPSRGAEADEPAKYNAQALSLKVYAWGEIACHIYLLLFLASERRIRKMGAQWRDGCDEVVIQMPGTGI